MMLTFSQCKETAAVQADTKGEKKTQQARSSTKFTTFLVTDTKNTCCKVAKPKRKSSAAKNYKQEQNSVVNLAPVLPSQIQTSWKHQNTTGHKHNF